MPSTYIRLLETQEQYQRYVDFEQDVYGEDSCWVPRDRNHTIGLISGRAPRCEPCQVQAFWAEQDQRIVATVTALVDEDYNRHWNEKLGHFVAFAALSGCAAAVEQLFGAASDWLGEQGCQAIRSTYLSGGELPMRIDAYDQVPTAGHGYNPPYYHGYFKSGGFETEKGMAQYQVEFTPELAARYRLMTAKAEREGVVLRTWNFNRLQDELVTYGRVFNEAFADHWGLSPVPEAHFQTFAEVKDELIPEFNVFAEVGGEVVGIVGSPPDMNQALHTARHQGFQRDSPEFRRAFEQIDHGVLLVIGVKKGFRGRGIASALAAKSYLGMIKRGYKIASYTPVLDDNWPSRHTAEKLHCRVTRNFIIYRKDLR